MNRERPTALRYLESSALVGLLLEGDKDVASSLSADGDLVASALTFAETSRAIVRATHSRRLGQEELRGILRLLNQIRSRTAAIAISGEILARVGRAFPIEPIRTLDAIHLASAESLGESPAFVTVVTRDKRLRENAQALGYVVE
ncbi:MAG: PIN domain-containing protein [Acidobacteria bacterium]|nr:MAG: PIN domain-containing protein [Acidobacteriota bacterium]